MTVPAFIQTIISDLQQWLRCSRSRYLYFRETEGKKIGVVFATTSPNFDRPALNKDESNRALVGLRDGKIDEGWVVAVRTNGTRPTEFLCAGRVEDVMKRLEGRPTKSGSYGEFYVLDLDDIDPDVPDAPF